MYETLKALSIRLDSPAQSLTKDALAQLLIKIVYANPNRMTFNQIWNQFTSIVGWDNAKRNEVISILNNLKNNELQFHKGLFYLSTAKRKEIDKTKSISANRFQYVIDTYIKPYFSKDETIKNWLQDTLITFFTSYSREWIADLCSKQNAVYNSITNIMEQISRRTNTNKEIIKEDGKHLIEAFKNILTANDPEIASLLWEYATAQFSSQLLKNGNNIDKLAVDTFSNAICILDTNILFHLSLPGADYSKHLNSIEKIFNSLGITVRYLHITKKEYINTIRTKSDEVLKSLEVFTPEVVAEADNQLVLAAKQLKCKSKEDFVRFFKSILEPPSVLDNTIMISLLDDDQELHKIITDAQNSNEKKTSLNSAYRSLTGCDKREHALVHDVGLISGVDYLRRNGKYFILSQDSSIINYAKQYPFLNGLPIAIKIETLLNVLAVNSYKNSCESYVSLFASIIRQGLQPKTNTFKIEDLHYIMEKEQFIYQLPNESVLSIVSDVSRRRLLGEDDETINKELTRKIQGEKFKVAAELQDAKLLINAQRHQNQQLTKDNEAGMKAHRERFAKDKNSKITRKIRKQYLYALLSFLGLTIGIGVVVILKQKISPNATNLLWDIIVAVITDFIGSAWSFIKGFLPKIKKLKSTRSAEVEKYVEEQIEKIYGQPTNAKS